MMILFLVGEREERLRESTEKAQKARKATERRFVFIALFSIF